MMSRAAISVGRRNRGSGAEVTISLRPDRSDTLSLIHDLAHSIGMDARLEPLPPEGGEPARDDQ
jgi:hypothetical protein